MAKTKEMTVSQYADFVGVSRPAIIYRMKKKKVLPGVKSYTFDLTRKKYIFKFDSSMTKEEALEYFQNLENYQK
jgi:DNA-binding Lrp family transcriptional regulator